MMDLLSIMKVLEESVLVRELQGINSFAGFGSQELPVWVKVDGVSVSVNGDVVKNFWKCFLIEDLEGVWYFVVLYTVEDCISRLLVPVVNLEELAIS